MPALNLTLTTAGIAAIAAAIAPNGTPVTITKVGLASTYSAPIAAFNWSSVIQIKRVTITSGSVSGGVVHIALNEEGTDAYTVKTIGLFTTVSGTDTLIGVYSQSSDILVKTANNACLFSIDVAITGAPPGSVTVGNTTFQFTQATETVRGVAEIATTSEALGLTDDTRIITPYKLGQVLPFLYHIRGSLDMRQPGDQAAVSGTWSWTRTLTGSTSTGTYYFEIVYPNTQYYIDACSLITSNHWIPFQISSYLYSGVYKVSSTNHAQRKITFQVPAAISAVVGGTLTATTTGSWSNNTGTQGFVIQKDIFNRFVVVVPANYYVHAYQDGVLGILNLTEPYRLPGANLNQLYVVTNDNGFGVDGGYSGTIKTLERMGDFLDQDGNRRKNTDIAPVANWNSDNFWFTDYAIPIGMNTTSRRCMLDLSYTLNV